MNWIIASNILMLINIGLFATLMFRQGKLERAMRKADKELISTFIDWLGAIERKLDLTLLKIK